MGMKLEEFFQRKGVPAEHVLDPRRVSDEYEREKLQKDLEAEKKKNAAGSGSDVIDVSGYMKDEKVVKKIEEPKAPIEPPKKPLRETLNIPPYNPQSAPAAPQQAAAPQAQIDRSFPWDRALIGATPLLVGLLTGNQQEGVKTAGDYWAKGEQKLYNDEQTLAMKLAQMKAKREEESGKGSRRYQAQTIALEDGTNVKGVFDTFTGKHLMPDGNEIPSNFIRAGYSVNPEEYDRRKEVSSVHKRKDADALGTGAYNSPTTGERAVVRDGREIAIKDQATGNLTVKQQNESKELRTEFRSNPIVKRVLPVLSSSNQLMELLNSGKAVSQAAAKTALARMSGEVGNLNQMEQDIYTRSPSIPSKIKGWLNLQATEEALTPAEAEDLKEIARTYMSASKELLGSAVAEMEAVAREDYDLPPETARRITSPIADPLMEQAAKGERTGRNPQVIYKGKAYVSENPREKLAVELDGQLHWTDATWEEVKKDYPNAKRLN